MGERALLVEVDTQAEVLGLYAGLRDHPLDGQAELVPAARSLLVKLGRGVDHEVARAELETRPPGQFEAGAATTVVIDVIYDGADLVEVGELTGLGTDGVITAHTAQLWTVAFGGFAPGFGYLTGRDLRLDVPRKAFPRTSVPAGSVGLAGRYSGIYPRSSPGGWQLIGRTAALLWDPTRDPPALLRPGMSVQFRAVESLSALSASPTRAVAESVSEEPARGLLVIRTGVFATIQDGGRTGYAELGVPPSGAVDQGAYAAANALVGNSEGAAALELTLGGFRARAVGDQLVAVTGAARTYEIRRSDGSTEHHSAEFAARLADGDLLAIGHPATGLRSYLAVRGGIDVPAVLGSRSTDVLSDLGPPAVRRDQRLAVGEKCFRDAPRSADARWSDPAGADSTAAAASSGPLLLLAGPHLRLLAPDALSQLVGHEWTVSPDSNRVGLRLAGTPIGRSLTDEMPSGPLVAGAIQIPPSGQPILFLRDHPVTGGYPVIAVLTDAGIDQAAQCRPGQHVHFALRP
jgi:KipI family sensor histidine kinase inhibitor